MERLLLGMPGFAIEKVVSYAPPIFEVRWMGANACPHCGSERLRIKDTFMRTIRNVPVLGTGSRFYVKCHKYLCNNCGKYFNTRLPGVKAWSRTTELLKRNIFRRTIKVYPVRILPRIIALVLPALNAITTK